LIWASTKEKRMLLAGYVTQGALSGFMRNSKEKREKPMDKERRKREGVERGSPQQNLITISRTSELE